MEIFWLWFVVWLHSCWKLWNFNFKLIQVNGGTAYGEIIIDEKCHTSEEGIYAAGDVTTVPYKQIVVSMGEGSKAALAAFEYLLAYQEDGEDAKSDATAEAA